MDHAVLAMRPAAPELPRACRGHLPVRYRSQYNAATARGRDACRAWWGAPRRPTGCSARGLPARRGSSSTPWRRQDSMLFLTFLSAAYYGGRAQARTQRLLRSAAPASSTGSASRPAAAAGAKAARRQDKRRSKERMLTRPACLGCRKKEEAADPEPLFSGFCWRREKSGCKERLEDTAGRPGPGLRRGPVQTASGYDAFRLAPLLFPKQARTQQAASESAAAFFFQDLPALRQPRC